MLIFVLFFFKVMRLQKKCHSWILTLLVLLCIAYLYTNRQLVCKIIKTHLGKFSFQQPSETTPPKSTLKTKRIAIYMPNTGGFSSWREYGDLVDRYRQAVKSWARDPLTKLPFTTVHCPLQNCNIDVITTINTTWLATCDAIIVNLDKLRNAPSYQRPAIKALGNKTKWFVFAMETADYYQFWNHDFKDIMFQYSITYHSESTVPYPYGRYVPKQPMNVKRRDWAAGKTRLVAWMASSCGAFAWPRAEWARQLQTMIPVDIYGKCGNLTCGSYDGSKPPSQNAPCMQELRKYKFYLALENAECDDYLTEKFWENALFSEAVPIVYGGRKKAYTRVAPPNSFIHISDFESMQKLADYIKYLDANNEAYNKYFAWRYVGRVEPLYPPLNISHFMCGIVPVLERNEKSVPFKTVEETDFYRSCSHTPLGSVLPLPKWKPRAG